MQPITLQQRPEGWMCMPIAFAMALDMPVADLLEAIGHDGSKIIFPNRPAPACHQGFHIQELIKAREFLQKNLVVQTPIDLVFVNFSGIWEIN